MRIKGRPEWGARNPIDPPRRINLPTPRLYVHHTGGNERGASGVRAIQRYHQDVRGYNDIAYSFLIDVDGTVWEGRGVGIAGGHTEGQNSVSHAICLMGNFENTLPTAAALDSLVQLAVYGSDRGWWVPTLTGHKDAPGASTACPGRHLYARLPELRARVAAAPIPVPTPPTGEVELRVHVLRRGASGGQVRALQALLNGKAGQALLIDGDFGPATENAVRNVQRFFQIPADGIVGASTWGVLFL